jgi:tetratricopeptide (TPR) repeat protein
VAELQDQLQHHLGSQYRLERELGGGGMSRVFLAEEIALGRKVVIKVLPPEMVSGVNQDRFRREIQLAARLQHPHIVPLLAAGAAGDLLWYAMPFIEGESLRVKLARAGELPVTETVHILREVADALAYAHAQGVVHRDIKPDNVMLSGRHALVTDFGVAKAVSASSGDHSLTSLGLALGTPAYMAPEQASADPHVDQRADLYALGAMAYEMLAGHPPFTGLSAQSILAAQITRAPETISSQRPAVPAGLNAVVMRCLEKRPADRWQSADELLPHLDALLTPSGSTASTSAVPAISSGTEAALRKGHPLRVALLFGVAALLVLLATNLLVNKLGLPGWVLTAAVALLLLGLPIVLATSIRERQRLLERSTGATRPEGGIGGLLTWRRALAGGGLAFAGLIVGVGAFMALRVAGVGPFATLLSAGVIKARDPLVMADFENRTSDSTLAPSVTEALRIDLTRSPLVRLLEASDVGATLRRMEKDPATPLTAAVAREVAERSGAAGVLTGEISPLGSGYVLSVRLIGTKDGATLLAERVTADGAGGLIAAVDKLSKKVREGIGESLRTVRGGEPLVDVTTHSLDALRKYSQADHAADLGDEPRAIALLKEAIQLDSSFAMAHRRLAALLGNTGANTSDQVAAARRAFELRDRLPEREKLLSTAYYYWVAEYDSDKIISAYQQVLETWPDDATAGNNLTIELNTRRRYPEAEAVVERALAASPQIGVLWTNLLEVLGLQGKFAKGDSVMARWAALQPASALRFTEGFRFYFGKGDYDVALAYADSATLRGNPQVQSRGHHQRANVFRIRGQLARADREELAEAQLNREGGRTSLALTPLVEVAQSNIVFRGRSQDGVRSLDSLLARLPELKNPVDRPYLPIANAYVRAGEVAKAERVVAEYEREVPEDLKAADFLRIYLHAMLALAKGQYTQALTGFREFREKNGGEVNGLFEIGQAFDGLQQSDSALTSYEAYATHPDIGPAGRQYFLPGALRRLGELYEVKSDKDKALLYYGKFTALWKDADADLMPQVQEVKKRMAALVAEPRRP